MIKNILGNKRIFAIEDDIHHLLITTNAISYYGASCYYAPLGRNIVGRLVNCLPIDLILLDLMFPNGITGYAVLADIRAHPLLSQTPVVAISALDGVTEIPKAKAAGFTGFIAKPIILEKFADQLIDVLTGRQVWIF